MDDYEETDEPMSDDDIYAAAGIDIRPAEVQDAEARAWLSDEHYEDAGTIPSVENLASDGLTRGEVDELRSES